jgi:hypothetical protein
MRLWGVTASVSYRPAHTRPNDQRFREQSPLLTGFTAQSTLTALIAHMFAHAARPGNSHGWRMSGGSQVRTSRLFAPSLFHHQLVKLRGRTQRGEFLILH